MRESRPIRVQLLLLTLAATLPFLIFNIVEFTLGIGSATAAAEQTSSRVARSLALRLDSDRTSAIDLLRSLAKRPAIQDLGQANGCDPVFVGFPEAFRQYGNLALYDAAGSPVCSAVPWPRNTSIAGQQWFRRIAQSRSRVMSGPERSPILKEWVVFHAEPILGAGGEFRGVLVAPVRVSSYQAMIRDVTDTSDEIVTILDERGTIVARSLDHERWTGRHAVDAESIRLALHTTETAFRAVGVDGVERLFGVAAVPGTGWRVQVGVPWRGVHAPVLRFIAWKSAVLAILLATVLTLGYFVARRIERPIVKLASDTRELLHTDREGGLSVAGPAEIATLARAFNEMLDVRRTRERLYGTILESTSEGIWMTDADAVVTFANQRAAAMLDQSVDALVGRSLYDALPPEVRDDVRTQFEACRRGKCENTEIVSRRDNGQQEWWSLATAPLFDPASRFTGCVLTMTDMTAHRRAELLVRESELRLQSIFSSAMDAIVTADDQQRIVMFNRAAEKLFGISAEQARGCDLSTLMPERFRRGHSEHVKRFGEANETQRSMGRLGAIYGLRANGEEFPIEASISHVEIDGRRLYTVILRDITERRRAEFRLEQETKFNRTIVNASPAFFIAADPQGRIATINDAMIEALGYAREELMNRPAVESLVSAEGRDAALEAFREASETDEAIGFEGPVRTKDGREILVEWRARPVRSETNELEFVFAIGLDVGERRREEAARWRSAELMAAVNDTAVTLLSHHDLDETLRGLAVRAASLTGAAGSFVEMYDRESAVRRVVSATGISARYLGVEIPQDEGIVAVVHRTGQTMVVRDYQEWPGANAEESGVRALAVIPIRSGNEVRGTFGVVESDAAKQFSAEQVEMLEHLAHLGSIAIDNARLLAEAQREVEDRAKAEAEVRRLNAELEERVLERTVQLQSEIAERRRAEEALQHRTRELATINTELAAAARMKDEFLANMSHELRTPLNAILGMAEVLMEGIHGPTSPKQQHSLSVIADSGTHLLELINDILDLSKIEAGKLDLDIQKVGMRAVVEASLLMVRETAFRKPLSLTTDLDPTVETIDADDRRLKQILVNLLSNAVKFTPAGGTVHVEIRGDSATNEVAISVIDTGIGIAEADLDRLFTAFFQVDSSYTKQYAGTGLGLSLVRRLADLHGGRLEVDSALGKGSRFTVVLPWRVIEVAAPEPSLPADERIAPAGDGPLLIVEDDAHAAEQIARYAADLGLASTISDGSEDVLALVMRIRPRVIILDIMFREASGWDILAALKARAETAGIPVILVTIVDDAPRGRALGAADYLLKPISRSRVLAALSRILPAEPGVPTVRRRPLILLAEDNRANVVVIESYFHGQGFDVIVAHDGLEAIEAALHHRPDLILMDVQMPKLDGLEATRRIRQATGEIASVPIIALSALAMAGDRERGFAAGANEYLTKPVSLRNLKEVIQRFLNRR